MVAGPYAPRSGQAKNSWLTGTAAWSFYAASQGILGIKPDYDGLRIDPCLPSEMTDVRVTRRFRGSIYHIHIVNRAGGEKGCLTLTMDGRPVASGVLPADGGAEHTVEAILESE